MASLSESGLCQPALASHAYRNAVNSNELFEDLADDGHPEAQNNLAVMYMNGQGTDVDYEEAAELLQKSADQGVTAAMFHLGILYLYGKGVDQDLDKAGSLLTEACDKNLNVACEKLELFQ